jgi:aminocarboxymuconate-semialdehyde decarboxylase
MLKIDTHTHILPPDWPDLAARFGDSRFPILRVEQGRHRIYRDGRFFREVQPNAWDARLRIEQYESFGISRQVVSTVPVLFCYWAPGAQALVLHQHLNDHLAQLQRDHPDRYVGLATVPLQDPALACAELRRSVQELGLAGVQIGSHVEDWNLDAPELSEFFATAEALDASVLIHPWDMMGAAGMPKYWMPWLVGMPAEQSRAACALIFGGVLERHPKLRIAFAHGGGSFPYTLGRIEHGFRMRPDLVAIDNPHPPSSYLARLYFDCCVHDDRALRYLIDTVGVDQVMLGTDYPFPLGEQEPGSSIERLGLAEAERSALFHGNALRWLGAGLRAEG